MESIKSDPTDVELPHNSDAQARAWSDSAAEYGTEFLDPFRDTVVNPLLGFLAEIDDTEAAVMTVADLGCGTGPLLPYLLDKFGTVIALDFANEMIAQCRHRLGPNQSARVRFLNRAMHDLEDLEESLDVAVTVNSLVMPDPRVVDSTLKSIYAALKPGGVVMGVVPSVDAIHHHTLMLWDAYLERGYSSDEARKLVSSHMEHAFYDFAFGKFDFNGISQKFWQPDELAFKLRKAGFETPRMVKLEYPWDDSLAGYKLLKDHPRTWDWTFQARRPTA